MTTHTVAHQHLALHLQAVDVRYGAVRALREIHLQIRSGEHVALVGANGSGKSTLLRVLHGLIPAQQGSVYRHPQLRQAMLFQQPHMLRASTQTNIALGLWLRGSSWKQAQAQAVAALQRVGLGASAQQNARTLSGGQQQRLALARAWALRPDVLLLDEPTASLDPYAKREVESLIADLASRSQAQPVTTIFSSHNLGQVKRLAKRVVYLEQGQILADLPVADFFHGATALPESVRLFLQGELV